MQFNAHLLKPGEACDYLNENHGIRRQASTLAKNRCIRADGPEFVKVGRAIYYAPEALDEYARRVISTPRRSTRNSATTARDDLF